MRLNEGKAMVIVRLPSKRSIGIKYCVSANECKSEFDMAECEEREVKKILSLKEELENGSKQPEDYVDLLDCTINLDDSEITQLLSNKMLENKMAKLQWLKVEQSLLSFDAEIKKSLGLDKAQPKDALKNMDEMLKLKIEPLMLKKHPHVVDMVKRLRRYVGNIKEWNLTEGSLEQFKSEAAKIRSKAEEVYIKFKVR